MGVSVTPPTNRRFVVCKSVCSAVEGATLEIPEFRATAVEYLNDSRELIHGLGILKDEVLPKRADELENTHYTPSDYHEIANAPAKANFIRSLCEAIESVEKRTYSNHIHC